MADFPDGLSMNTNDSAGDVSASVEETNRFAIRDTLRAEQHAFPPMSIAIRA